MLIPLCSLAQHNETPRQENQLVAGYHQQFTHLVTDQLNKIDWNQAAHKTTNGTVLYTIPVVVHVLHDYRYGLVADNSIFDLITGMNRLFLKTTPDTIGKIVEYWKECIAPGEFD